MKYCILLCGLLMSTLAIAGQEGNGGDPCEKRIQEIRNDLSMWIEKGGPEGLKLPNWLSVNRYSRGMLTAIGKARVSCTDHTLYVGVVEKACKNFVDENGLTRLVCNVDRFMKQTSESDQYVLIHHEYAGVAGFEVNNGEESDYVISNQISGFLVDRVVKKLAIKPNQNGMGMTFVKIQPGTFMMGSPETEENRDRDEILHQVTLSQGFEIQTTTVTQAQWVAVMKSNPSYFAEKKYCPETFIPSPIAMCPNNPVEQVSWNDIPGFLLSLNMALVNEGYLYRLPTEAEWEYAARAGTQTPYYFGDPRRFFAYGWYEDTSGKQTHEVGQLKPNAWGLYDMVGNVRQLINDRYEEYPKGSVTDPTGPSSDAYYRVTRGGDWSNSTMYMRSAERSSLAPEYRWNRVGFRLVRTQ